jgi:hypothetical protein
MGSAVWRRRSTPRDPHTAPTPECRQEVADCASEPGRKPPGGDAMSSDSLKVWCQIRVISHAVRRRGDATAFAKLPPQHRLVADCMFYRALAGYLDGEALPTKALITEVVPDWASVATAHRVVRLMIDAGYLAIVPGKDNRSVRVRPSSQSLATAGRRAARILEELRNRGIHVTADNL